MPPLIQTPRVTAGFNWPPENLPTEYAPTMTAKPQPNVMTIQPEFCAFDLLRSTAATTPSPRRIRIAVPIHSEPMMLKSLSLLSVRMDGGDTILARSTMSNGVRNTDTRFVIVSGHAA